MTGTVIGNSMFMDAIGMSVGLAGASFTDNEGYTIFAGLYNSPLSSPSSNNKLTVTEKTFEKPVQGIMGWFGTGIDNNLSNSSESAVSSFSNNIGLEPHFFAPFGLTYKQIGMEVDSSQPINAFICEYTPGISTTATFYVRCNTNNKYGTICCYFYIFF